MTQNKTPSGKEGAVKNLIKSNSSIPQNNYGARPEDWVTLQYLWGVTPDMLPVVSNPNATISPNSSLASLGKTPSLYNGRGHVTGIAKWTEKQTTDDEIERWSSNPDYGIALQTRGIRAIDVDVTELGLSEAVAVILENYLGFNHSKRSRMGSSKFLVPYRLEDNEPLYKKVIKTDHGIIEFLGNGQQFICAGLHVSSGTHYDWGSDGIPGDVPTITRGKLNELISELSEVYAIEDVLESRANLGPGAIDDPLFDALEDKGLILAKRRDGSYNIECPYANEHGSVTVASSTTYFAPHTNGYAKANIKCLHATCNNRSQRDYEEALGIHRDVDLLPDLDKEDVLKSAIDANQKRQAEVDNDTPALDIHAQLPDVMREVATEYLSSALYCDQELATALIISAFGGMLSGGFSTHNQKTSTAQYFVFSADTGSGKEQLQRLASCLFKEAGKDTRISDIPASEAAFCTMLERDSNSYILTDEFGETLRGMFDRKGSPHKKAIPGMLMKLRTKVGSVFYGADYANPAKRPRAVINNPCLSVAGFTTPSQLHESLADGAIESGFLPRLLIIKSQQSCKQHNKNSRAFATPKSFTQWCEAIRRRESAHTAPILEDGKPSEEAKETARPCTDIPLSREAELSWHHEMEKKDKKMHSMREAGNHGADLISRRIEIAQGIALVFTLARKPDATEISNDDFKLAIKFVAHHQDSFVKHSLPDVGASDFSRLEKEVLGVIRKLFDRNKESVNQRALVNSCRKFKQSDQMTRVKVIEALVDQDAISMEAGARGAKRYLPL